VPIIDGQLLSQMQIGNWSTDAGGLDVLRHVNERPVVQVRDLSVAGRVTLLRWRKHRFWCVACERTVTSPKPNPH